MSPTQPTIHLRVGPGGMSIYCGRTYSDHLGFGSKYPLVPYRYRAEWGASLGRSTHAKLISWAYWLTVIHPAPFRLCGTCRRLHAREL
jgi:hypothetical protein